MIFNLGNNVLAHQRRIEKIRKQLANNSGGQKYSLRLSRSCSRTSRHRNYTKASIVLDISCLDHIISIDPKRLTIWVEPGVSMERLVRKTLEYGLIAPVIPGFKAITVGGAILGTGLDVSSHSEGLFSDHCLSYEVLLGDGTVVRATAEEHPDLFHGLVGSYGSLGVVLSAEIQLIPAQPWVKLKHHHLSSIDEALDFMNGLHERKQAPVFIEGFMFSPRFFTVTEGNFIRIGSECAKLPRVKTLFYYQHVIRNASSRNITEEKISLSEYLFRHDQGVFWCSGNPSWAKLWKYWLIKYFHLPSLYRNDLKNWIYDKEALRNFHPERETIVREQGSSEDGNFEVTPTPSETNSSSYFGLARFFGRKSEGPNPPAETGKLLNLLWAYFANDLSYYYLHLGNEERVARRMIDQTFLIPFNQASLFVRRTFESTNIIPLWLCPACATRNPEIFSPHFSSNRETTLFLAVGIFGNHVSARAKTYELEKVAYALQGRKMFYACSYLAPEEFWTFYPKNTYEELRHRYHASPWIEIDKKVLQ